MIKNFYISTDSDGHCPVLNAKPLKPFWTKYINDTPVHVYPYNGQDRVWDYNKSTMLSIKEGVLDYTGKPMKMYTGKIG